MIYNWFLLMMLNFYGSKTLINLKKQDFIPIIITPNQYYSNKNLNDDQIFQLYIRYLLLIFIQLDSKKIIEYNGNKYPEELIIFLKKLHNNEIYLQKDDDIDLTTLENNENFNLKIFNYFLKNIFNNDLNCFFLSSNYNNDYCLSIALLQELINDFGSSYFLSYFPIYPNFVLEKKMNKIKNILKILNAAKKETNKKNIYITFIEIYYKFHSIYLSIDINNFLCRLFIIINNHLNE